MYESNSYDPSEGDAGGDLSGGNCDPGRRYYAQYHHGTWRVAADLHAILRLPDLEPVLPGDDLHRLLRLCGHSVPAARQAFADPGFVAAALQSGVQRHLIVIQGDQRLTLLLLAKETAKDGNRNRYCKGSIICLC